MPRIALLLVAFVGLACTGRGVASEDSPLVVEPLAAEELPRPRTASTPTERDFPVPVIAPQKLPAIEVGADAKPGPGALLVEKDGKVLAIPLQHTTVDTVVTGTIAETTVTQLFVNPFEAPIEALYLFPLPHDAAVDDYWFHVGKRHVHGVMKERDEAQKIYENAKREGKTAALLEQDRPNVFQQSVANIAPGESILVEMHMAHPLEQIDGTYNYAFPTVVGEHYRTGREAGQHAGQGDGINPPRLPKGMRSGHDVAINVTIDTGLAAREVVSKSHRIVSEQRDDVTRIRLADEDAIPDQDFVLSWKMGDDEPRAWIMTQRRDDATYFSLTVQPPAKPARANARGRELVFVVDTSGSMSGAPIETVKRAMSRVLDDMRPDDAFQVLQFSQNVSSLGSELVPNTAANRARAREYVRDLEASGGTEFICPLNAALALPHDSQRTRLVMFMTDGYVSNDHEVFGALDRSIADTRLFAFGVGTAPNRALLDGMALFGRGHATYLRPEEDEAHAVDRFYERVAQPVLTDISVDFGGLAVSDVVPARIPDLFAGQPVVIFGKLDGDLQGTVTLQGKLGGETIALPVVIDTAATAGRSVGLSSMWARKRIDDLLLPTYAMSFDDPRREDARKRVVELALEYAVMTEYTAFVAVDEQRVVDEDGKLVTVEVAVPMPEGMTMGTIGLGSTGIIGKGGGGGGSGYGRGSAGGFGGRGSRVPRVRQARADVKGALDKDIIRRVVRSHINEVRACYNQGLAKDPNLKGRVEIAFTIGADGKVTLTKVASTTLSDANVGTCIATTMKRWVFPKPDSGSVAVTYPFVLEAG